MPTIISHIAVPLMAGAACNRKLIPVRLLAAGMIASILPDADAIGYRLGIPYNSTFGHRGFSHSVAFALLLGLLGFLCAKWLRSRRMTVFLLLFGAALSHGLLDAATSGGYGIAFCSPFRDERFFLPWRPIRVAPLSIIRFLSFRGWKVLQSEFLWIWLPVIAISVVCILMRRFKWNKAEK